MTEIYTNPQVVQQKYITSSKTEENTTQAVPEETSINVSNTKTAYVYDAVAPLKAEDYKVSEEFYGAECAFFSNETMAEISDRIAYFPCNVNEAGIVSQLDEFPGKFGHNYYVFVKSVEIPNTSPTEYRWILDSKVVIKPDEYTMS